MCSRLTFELRIPLPDTVALQCRQANLEGTGEIRLRRLVKEALRMRPSRIIVGEVRQEECLDLLIALNSGLPEPRALSRVAGGEGGAHPDDEIHWCDLSRSARGRIPVSTMLQ